MDIFNEDNESNENELEGNNIPAQSTSCTASQINTSIAEHSLRRFNRIKPTLQCNRFFSFDGNKRRIVKSNRPPNKRVRKLPARQGAGTCVKNELSSDASMSQDEAAEVNEPTPCDIEVTNPIFESTPNHDIQFSEWQDVYTIINFIH